VVSGLFGVETDSKIIAQVKEIGKAGFGPYGTTVRSIAYKFAVELNLPHRFNNEEQMAGHEWMRSFIDSNSDWSVQQSGLSVARAKGTNRTDMNNYFKILQEILAQNGLLDDPQNISNTNETVYNVNNRGEDITEKGTKLFLKSRVQKKGNT
jgi:hypothetical protein